MSDLNTHSINLNGGGVSASSSSMNGGDVSSASTRLEGGSVDTVDITLDSEGVDINAKKIHGKPILLGTTNLSIIAGKSGKDGKDGKDGKSAYQAAVENGYIGTEQEFGNMLAHMKVVDDLETEDSQRPLSANQGAILKRELEEIKYWYKLNDN